MSYNPFNELKNHRFSLKTDYNQTLEDVDSLIKFLYKITGSEMLVEHSQNLIGPLEERIKRQIEPWYALGAATLVHGIATGQPKIFIGSGSAYALGLLHHYVMTRNHGNIPIQLNL